MSAKVEKVTESSYLGEAPHWHLDQKVLYYVDIPGSKLLKYDPSTKELNTVSVAPQSASFIIPVKGQQDQFVVSLDNELVIISWDGKSDKITKIKTLATANFKFNDAKCDVTGRLWAGTVNIPPEGSAFAKPEGSLYSLEGNGKLVEHVNKVSLSNGLAFNEQAGKLYYIDSLKRTIDQFDFEPSKGIITNRTELFSLSNHNLQGNPDGMAIDSNGNLWVALFRGDKVIKIDGKTPETLLTTIDIPVNQVTSVAWGGSNLDELYVTTAARGPQQTRSPPPNGSTYVITGTGSRGLPAPEFQL